MENKDTFFCTIHASQKYNFLNYSLVKQKLEMKHGVEHVSPKHFPFKFYSSSLDSSAVFSRLGKENKEAISCFYNGVLLKFYRNTLQFEENELPQIFHGLLVLSKLYSQYDVKVAVWEDVDGHCFSNADSCFRTVTKYSRIRIILSSKSAPTKSVHLFFGKSNSPVIENGFNTGLVVKNLDEKLSCASSKKVVTGMQSNVILGSGSGGILFHETCGHMLESDKILNGLSPFAQYLNKRVAPPCFSFVDNPLLENSFGYYEIDDEGEKCKPKQLIKQGKINDFLCIKEDLGRYSGFRSSGNARRENYYSACSPRMSNTFVSPTDISAKQIFDSVKEGVYCKELQSGIVSPLGDFSFYCPVLYLIKDGIIKTPLKPSFVRGNILHTMNKIAAIGDDLSFSSGFCNGRSGFVPVSVGQPTMLIKDQELFS